MKPTKTHTGLIVTKDGDKRLKLHQTATTWCVGPARHTTNLQDVV